MTYRKESSFAAVLKNNLSAQYQHMPLIGLITDWQQSDYYLGAMKGTIYSKVPDAKIIDISHTISTHNVFQAAFVLKSCFEDFPEDTIFIMGVNSYANGINGYLCIKYRNRYIITSDNGLFSLFTEDPYDLAIKLENIPTTFPEKDIFALYACRLLQNELIQDLGPNAENLVTNMNFHPMLERNIITGMVMYIDNFGNGITNVSRTIFEKIGKNRSFSIFPGNNEFEIKEISVGYENDEEGDLIALFNSLDLLEIVNIKSSASALIKLEVKTNIRILFYDT